MDRRDGWEGGSTALPTRRRAVVAGAATALLVAGLAPFASTSSAITPQAEQTWETGVISSVADGDTVKVDIQTAADPGFIAPARSGPALLLPRSHHRHRHDAR